LISRTAFAMTFHFFFCWHIFLFFWLVCLFSFFLFKVFGFISEQKIFRTHSHTKKNPCNSMLQFTLWKFLLDNLCQTSQIETNNKNIHIFDTLILPNLQITFFFNYLHNFNLYYINFYTSLLAIDVYFSYCVIRDWLNSQNSITLISH